MLSPTTPFLLHAFVEPLAASSFILSPASQIPNPDRESALLSHLLGGALLHSSFTALIFFFRPLEQWDATGRCAALAFAFWHLWPCYRALVRLSLKETKGTDREKTLGGPISHLGVHGLFISLFVWSAMQ
ncbi:hypothetical protein jhhlp_008425 [Lomentospora prolificans]|uniref:TLC domain-containing protein n=1 Tax=Lomentospora prolificans TaxID=41688 RepID=A0A2N3MY00_9PEZI|nr:hypothetical protein jhhlp_008425 [Lomentospora prolificans]